jgi:hypothetical protein
MASFGFLIQPVSGLIWTRKIKVAYKIQMSSRVLAPGWQLSGAVADNGPTRINPGDSPKKRAAVKRHNEQSQVTEDLGTQLINGVQAHGVRATLTIAVGAIGNDRPLKVVTETWSSDALGVLVKSMNSDPRFGTTTYELTNIVQGPPNPALFEIPGDYTVR